MASAWERALTQRIGGGSLGSLTRSAASNAVYKPAAGAGSWERAAGGGGGGGSLGASVASRLPQPPPRSPLPPVQPGSVGSSVVDAAAAGGNGGAVTQTKFNYPASLPAISPDVEAAFAQQRRVGQRGVEDAEAYRQAGESLAEARKLSAQGEITRQAGRDINQVMADYAAGGRAFSPMGVFPARTRVAAGAERQQVVLEEELAQTVQELNRLVADAERAREETNAGIEMQRAIMRSQAALEELRGREAIDRMNQQMGFV